MQDENNVATIEAVETTEKQTQTLKQRRFIHTKSPEEFVADLQKQQDACEDYLVPFEKFGVLTTIEEHLDEEGMADLAKLRLIVGEKELPFYRKVVTQVASIAKMRSGKNVPGSYIRNLIADATDHEAVELAATNLETFLRRRHGQTRKSGDARQVLVRTIKQNGQEIVRAVLSDKYFPLNTIDMVVAALGVVSGKIGKAKDSKDSAAHGARVFDWNLSPFAASIGFVNPSIAFDLKNPEKGVMRVEPKEDAHGWVYPGGGSFDLRQGFSRGRTDQHLVFPSCFIKNDETGGGSAVVELSLMEAVCRNTAKIGIARRRTHVGGTMNAADDYTSDTARRKAKELWVANMADSLTEVFDIEAFESTCRDFLGLKDIAVKDVKVVTEKLLGKVTGGEDLLADVLKAYHQMDEGKDTMLDVQRSLTAAAQVVEDPEQGEELEALAGGMITGKVKVRG